jgi:hypothetical protein
LERSYLSDFGVMWQPASAEERQAGNGQPPGSDAGYGPRKWQQRSDRETVSKRVSAHKRDNRQHGPKEKEEQSQTPVGKFAPQLVGRKKKGNDFEWVPEAEPVPVAHVEVGPAKAEECPLCKMGMDSVKSTLIHVVLEHGFWKNIQTSFLQNGTNGSRVFCRCGKSMDDKLFLGHLVDDHAYEIYTIIKETVFRKGVKEWSIFCEKVSALASLPEPERIDEEDREYEQFIASSIDGKGVDVKTDDVKLGELRPLDPERFQTKESGGAINDSFWGKLEVLLAYLESQGKVEIGEKYYCCTCKKKFGSFVKLLQHCWETHKDMISRFE